MLTFLEAMLAFAETKAEEAWEQIHENEDLAQHMHECPQAYVVAMDEWDAYPPPQPPSVQFLLEEADEGLRLMHWFDMVRDAVRHVKEVV